MLFVGATEFSGSGQSSIETREHSAIRHSTRQCAELALVAMWGVDHEALWLALVNKVRFPGGGLAMEIVFHPFALRHGRSVARGVCVSARETEFTP